MEACPLHLEMLVVPLPPVRLPLSVGLPLHLAGLLLSEDLAEWAEVRPRRPAATTRNPRNPTRPRLLHAECLQWPLAVLPPASVLPRALAGPAATEVAEGEACQTRPTLPQWPHPWPPADPPRPPLGLLAGPQRAGEAASSVPQLQNQVEGEEAEATSYHKSKRARSSLTLKLWTRVALILMT